MKNNLLFLRTTVPRQFRPEDYRGKRRELRERHSRGGCRLPESGRQERAQVYHARKREVHEHHAQGPRGGLVPALQGDAQQSRLRWVLGYYLSKSILLMVTLLYYCATTVVHPMYWSELNFNRADTRGAHNNSSTDWRSDLAKRRNYNATAYLLSSPRPEAKP